VKKENENLDGGKVSQDVGKIGEKAPHKVDKEG
jgi:hypothetical protein